jgi:hypothetical protein
MCIRSLPFTRLAHGCSLLSQFSSGRSTFRSWPEYHAKSQLPSLLDHKSDRSDALGVQEDYYCTVKAISSFCKLHLVIFRLFDSNTLAVFATVQASGMLCEATTLPLRSLATTEKVSCPWHKSKSCLQISFRRVQET